jgi:hypothetical protein
MLEIDTVCEQFQGFTERLQLLEETGTCSDQKVRLLDQFELHVPQGTIVEPGPKAKVIDTVVSPPLDWQRTHDVGNDGERRNRMNIPRSPVHGSLQLTGQ